jgi:hypothetical protein
VDTEAAVRAWIDAWRRGWVDGDPDLVAERYAPEAVLRSHPFREPYLGTDGARDYARAALEGEEDVTTWFGEPVVTDDRAAVEYWATLLEEGEPVTIAGTSMLRFGADGRVVEHRDYWSIEPGGRGPPEGWGR